MKKGLDKRIKKKWLPVYAGIWIVMAAMVILLAEDIALIIELKEAENQAQSDAMQVFNVSRGIELGEHVAIAPLNLTEGG